MSFERIVGATSLVGLYHASHSSQGADRTIVTAAASHSPRRDEMPSYAMAHKSRNPRSRAPVPSVLTVVALLVLDACATLGGSSVEIQQAAGHVEVAGLRLGMPAAEVEAICRRRTTPQIVHSSYRDAARQDRQALWR